MRTAAPNITHSFISIYYVSGAQLLYAFHDVIIKWVSGQYPVHELILIRSCVSMLPILALVWWKDGPNPFKTDCLAGHILRALFAFASYICFYLALSALPFAVAVSLFFTNPIFITILSVWFLKEKVETGGWVALLSGFLGVVIMLNPGSGMADPAAFLVLLSALFYAAGSIMTRHLGKTESGESLTVYIMGVYIIASLVMAMVLSNFNCSTDAHPSLAFFLRDWHMPPRKDILLLVSMGLVSSAGIYFLSQAYRLGQPSQIAPFEYIAVPLSVVLGYLLWNEVLALKTAIGIALIIASGLYIVQHKNRGADHDDPS